MVRRSLTGSRSVSKESFTGALEKLRDSHASTVVDLGMYSRRVSKCNFFVSTFCGQNFGVGREGRYGGPMDTITHPSWATFVCDVSMLASLWKESNLQTNENAVERMFAVLSLHCEPVELLEARSHGFIDGVSWPFFRLSSLKCRLFFGGLFAFFLLCSCIN